MYASLSPWSFSIGLREARKIQHEGLLAPPLTYGRQADGGRMRGTGHNGMTTFNNALESMTSAMHYGITRRREPPAAETRQALADADLDGGNLPKPLGGSERGA